MALSEWISQWAQDEKNCIADWGVGGNTDREKRNNKNKNNDNERKYKTKSSAATGVAIRSCPVRSVLRDVKAGYTIEQAFCLFYPIATYCHSYSIGRSPPPTHTHTQIYVFFIR